MSKLNPQIRLPFLLASLENLVAICVSVVRITFYGLVSKKNLLVIGFHQLLRILLLLPSCSDTSAPIALCSGNYSLVLLCTGTHDLHLWDHHCWPHKISVQWNKLLHYVNKIIPCASGNKILHIANFHVCQKFCEFNFHSPTTTTLIKLMRKFQDMRYGDYIISKNNTTLYLFR